MYVRHLVGFIFLLGIVVTGSNATCFQPPYSTGNLTFCTEYSGLSCCSAATDERLSSIFDSIVGSQFGTTSNCSLNVKSILCAVGCSPDITSYGSISFSDFTITFHMEPTYLAEVYASCQYSCPLGIPASSFFANESVFINSFSTANIPGYTPSLNTPGIAYSTTASSGGSLFNHSVYETNPSSAVPCTCPLLNGSLPQSDASLAFCNYTSACCTSQQDAAARATYMNLTATIGQGSCAQNLKNAICALTCSPDQGTITSFSAGQEGILSLPILDTYADQVYGVCRNICIGNSTTVADRFKTAASLFGSVNINSSAVQYMLSFEISANTSASFSTDVIPATFNETQGCPAAVVTSTSATVTTTEQASTSSASVASAFFVFYLAGLLSALFM